MDDDVDHPGDDLYALCLAIGRQHKLVLETLGNEPGAIEHLLKLKRELHELALRYVDEVRAKPWLGYRLLGEQANR